MNGSVKRWKRGKSANQHLTAICLYKPSLSPSIPCLLPLFYFPLFASLLFTKPKHSSTRLPLFLAQHRRAGNVPHEAGCVPSLLSCFWVSAYHLCHQHQPPRATATIGIYCRPSAAAAGVGLPPADFLVQFLLA